MKLGARILKTGVAIMLSLYIAIGLNLEMPMFAAVAAVFAIQPSIYRTFQTILEHIQANIIGATIAIVFVLTFGHDPFVVGVVAIITIAIILKLKLESNVIPLALVTVIIIMESPAEDFLMFASLRLLLILIGVFSAFLVNLFFIPPRYETKLYNEIVDHSEQTIQWIMLFMRRDANHRTLKTDIKRLDDKMIKIENLYLFYKEERNYLLQNKYSKARKVVLFRQMISTFKKALFLLKNLERREHEISHLNSGIEELLTTQLDRLTQYHDRILLRYIGRVISRTTEEQIEEMNRGRTQLTEHFMELYKKDDLCEEQWHHLLPIISHIVEYEEKLKHLDQLVDSFFSYHKEENRVHVKEENK